MIKRIFILCVLAAGMLMQSCGEEELTGLSTNYRQDVVLTVGGKLNLTATLKPAGADASLVWTSSNESVAGVSGNVLTVVGVGKTVITVSSGNYSASFNLEGVVRSVTITAPEGIEIEVGTRFQLTATIDPAGLSVSPVWSSDNEAVATVSASGEVTVTGNGTANIRATVGSTFDVYTIVCEDMLASAVGRWEFDDRNDLVKAIVGNPLEKQGDGFTFVDGPNVGNGAVRIDKGSYFVARHGIAANGGGSRVNNYTLMVDFKVSELGRYYCFLQTSPANNDDGDFFINPSGNLGIGSTGYSVHVVSPGEWHRLVLSASMGNSYLTFLDGTLIYEGNVGNATMDSRFSWLPEGVLLFADEDGEDAEIDIAEVIIWDGALNAGQVQSLGPIR